MPLAALDYLAKPNKYPAQAVVVIFGKETFLQHLVLEQLRGRIWGSGEGFDQKHFDGRTAEMAELVDVLSTKSLFGDDRRVAVVEAADEFVSRFREPLERYLNHPSQSAVLILLPEEWRANTKLAKAVEQTGLAIECKPPSERKLTTWLIEWAEKQHDKTLDRDAAADLVSLVGAQLGLLDQELAKLASFAQEKPRITAGMVGELVAGWRKRTAFEMLDAAVDGKTAEALRLLSRLLEAGEQPVGVLAQMAATLRKYAAAARLILQAEAQGQQLGVMDALKQAGISFKLPESASRLKALGRKRATQLYGWLRQADLDLKGESPLPPRTVLEQLIARISVTPSGLSTRTSGERPTARPG